MNEIKCWSGRDAIDLYNEYRSVNDQTKKENIWFSDLPDSSIIYTICPTRLLKWNIYVSIIYFLRYLFSPNIIITINIFF